MNTNDIYIDNDVHIGTNLDLDIDVDVDVDVDVEVRVDVDVTNSHTWHIDCDNHINIGKRCSS